MQNAGLDVAQVCMRVCVCAYVCMSVYLCVCARMCVFMHVCACVIMHVYVCACGDQGSNLCLLHWQVNPLPLKHQGSPENHFIMGVLLKKQDRIA